MASAASPTSAESDPPSWKHDVFLSFRGEDTRRDFVSHLDRALAYWQAMKTFKDDRDLEVGATIRPELLTAIEESYIAIIVLSPNYASSTWCLDELSKILECMEDTKRILPIFYHVDPSDVRKQTGSFAEAFTKHEERYSGDSEKLNRWKAALTEVADLSGLHSKNYKSEAELIQNIVKSVWKKVHPTIMLSGSPENLVGIDFALEQLRLQLAPEENDVRFIGLYGMGGVGKTTLAELVFERISHNFELSSFLYNVREVSATKGTLVDLQKKLIFPILKEENIIRVWDEESGIVFTKKFLWNKKVLLVLDDVDKLNQLEKLVGEKTWFGVGSRIIITTRNEGVLVQHDIATRYKVEVLNDGQALNLFSRHALKKNQPAEGFLELSLRVLHYAKGLPLALKTLGSFLYTRGQDAWNSVLHNLEKIPDPTVFHSLKVSYDGLEEMEKKIFLLVACFYKGQDKKEVIETLDSIWDISSLIGMDILIEKSLSTIKNKFLHSGTIEMHDLIQEMAWEIVRQESIDEKRSFLWHSDDISSVFMNNTGTCAIEAIVLRLPESEVVNWNCNKAFSKMPKLRLLEFDNVIFSSDHKVLPNSLRIIRWSTYVSKSLPPKFHPRFLVKLEMRHSKLLQPWDGAKYFPNLKFIDLSYSHKLASNPDFTHVPILEELNLTGCTGLIEVHASIAVLKRLKRLDLSDCESIMSLPSRVEMDSLEYFSLVGCSKVKRLPEFEGHMKNLFNLFLQGTAVEQIPSSIEGLVGLFVIDGRIDDSFLSVDILYMQRCSRLVKLPWEKECLEELELSESAMRELRVMKNHKDLSLFPSMFGNVWFRITKSHPDPAPDHLRLMLSSLSLFSLTCLYLAGCNIGEGVIPDDIGFCFPSLIDLTLNGNNFVSLPPSIRFLSKLRLLDLSLCERLEQLPDLPSSGSLHVNVDGCTSLRRLSDPSNLGTANVYDFSFNCYNCFRLVEEEGWINRIFAMIMRIVQPDFGPGFKRTGGFVWPGTEIPEWFSKRSVGNSITVELPLPPHPQSSCSSDWAGIAFCVLFQDSKYMQNPAAFAFRVLIQDSEYFEDRTVQCWDGPHRTYGRTRHPRSQHLYVFYFHRELVRRGFASGIRPLFRQCSTIKECGARLVCERDLEEFSGIVKMPKPNLISARHAYDHGAGPFQFSFRRFWWSS